MARAKAHNRPMDEQRYLPCAKKSNAAIGTRQAGTISGNSSCEVVLTALIGWNAFIMCVSMVTQLRRAPTDVVWNEAHKLQTPLFIPSSESILKAPA